jgi:pyruvate dehydrogenase (quinone)/pyruvate oxidase
MGAAHVEPVVDLACRTALAYRGVSHIGFPVDLQEAPATRGSKRNVPHHTSDVHAQSARLPSEGDLRRAADVLNAGER